MEANNRYNRWYAGLGVLALGALALSLTLHDAAAEDDVVLKNPLFSTRAAPIHGGVQVSPGAPQPMSGKMQVLPSVKVDYRTSGPLQEGSGWVKSGFRACALDEECNDCDPCTEDTCQAGTCVNRAYLPGEIAPDCDDDLHCNGLEECVAGECAPSTVPPCLAPDVCDEAEDSCVTACVPGPLACNDGRACTPVDTCASICEGGDNHAEPCTVPANCPGGRCVDTCTHTKVDCGLNGVCREDGMGAHVCSKGRCCFDVDPTHCEHWTAEACYNHDPNDMWLGVNDCYEGLDCPKYGGGIIDGRLVNWGYPFAYEPGVVTVGGVSGLACDSLTSIGDDYKLINADTEWFLELQHLRFAAYVYPGWSARFAIELRDENGLLIEDVFYPDAFNATGGPAIRTVEFDPPLIIPTTGIISISVAEDFGPGGRVAWLSTDQVDVGYGTSPFPDANDTTKLFVNGAVVDADVLGQCNGGDRDGEWCDRRNGNADCTGTPPTPNGTCDDVPDILAFEIIGEYAPEPLGACCDVAMGTCAHELPWDCEAQGNVFKGIGVPCGLCTEGTGAGQMCDGDEDCNDPPITGACQQQICSISQLPCWLDDDPPVYQCTIVGETCVDLAAACATQACCNDATGDCEEVVGIVLSCDELGPGWTSLGFGTDCDPNCCPQTGPSTQGDNCNLVTPVVINVPDDFTVATKTLTGNNSAATFDDWNDGWCKAHVFNPDGDTKDPGWWEAFSIDDCANVRIQLCCSDPVVRPAWGDLFTGCPCEVVLQTAGIDPPIGIGEDNESAARGAPFCDEDNLWMTFGPLEAGVYYYPLYSAPDGTYASPPGGTYQLNILVQKCPVTSCCYLGCTGDTDVVCADDADCSVAGGTCEPQCLDLNELDCEARAGWWGGYEDPPDTVCTGPQGQCLTGACCLEPGVCEDTVPDRAPMTYDLCVNPPKGGRYIGGASCADDPCPLCPIESPSNCLEPDHIFGARTDSGETPDLRRAEDFVADANSIGEVCISGGWIYRTDLGDTPDLVPGEDFAVLLPGSRRIDCACVNDTQESDCEPQVEDVYTVSIYDDNDGVPNNLVASRVLTEDGLGADGKWYRGLKEMYDFYDTWMISLKFDENPITGLMVDETYWLAVDNNTTNPDPNTCTWVWMANLQGGNDWHMADRNEQWEESDGRAYDLAFCVGQTAGFSRNQRGTDPIAPVGRCCLCDPPGDCEDLTTLRDCEGAPFEAGDLGGAWDKGMSCTDGPGCPDELPDGDVCRVAIKEEPIHEAFDGPNDFSNQCADTDGPNPVKCENDWQRFGNDVWYAYTATCTGIMTVDMCEGPNYDGIIAIYRDPSDPTTCDCPPEQAKTGPSLQYGLGADDTCGVVGGPPTISKYVEKGKCYTIRIAGWAADERPRASNQAAGGFQIICGECDHPVPDTAIAEPCVVEQGTNGTRNRYLGFSGGLVEGEPYANPMAIRVKFVDIPGSDCDGQHMWVADPRDVSEKAATLGSSPPDFVAATLRCYLPSGDGPDFRDWSIYEVLYVYHEYIVPGATYEIQLVPMGCEGAEDAYSTPLTIRTSKWGDVVGEYNEGACCTRHGYTDCWTAPNGVTNFDDISSLVDKFRNLYGAPQKSRADIAGDPPAGIPDQLANFVDISYDVDA
ncbi:MAG: hypothetical protein WBE26_13975, partial [Phycisphaerae bacterium]